MACKLFERTRSRKRMDEDDARLDILRRAKASIRIIGCNHTKDKWRFYVKLKGKSARKKGK